MNEDIKEKSDEILEILEHDLIKHLQGMLKASTGVDCTEKDAEVILAKIGKKLLMKLLVIKEI